MKVIVCGGRGFSDRDAFNHEMDQQHAELTITELMQGGCPTGADNLARLWARGKPEIRRWVCHAKWTIYGRAAGPMRNARMIEWRPDVVIAFPGGRGTEDMVAKAEAACIPVRRVLQPMV